MLGSTQSHLRSIGTLKSLPRSTSFITTLQLEKKQVKNSPALRNTRPTLNPFGTRWYSVKSAVCYRTLVQLRSFATHSHLPNSSNNQNHAPQPLHTGHNVHSSLAETLKKRIQESSEARDERRRQQQQPQPSGGPPVSYREQKKSVVQRLREHIWDHTPAEYFQIATFLAVALLCYLLYKLYRAYRAALAHRPDSSISEIGVHITSPLMPITDRVWMAEYMFRTDIGGIPQLLKSNMYILQMWDSGSDGKPDCQVLLVYNPVKLTPNLKEEIQALGLPIKFIVVPVHDPQAHFAGMYLFLEYLIAVMCCFLLSSRVPAHVTLCQGVRTFWTATAVNKSLPPIFISA
jgi:hypothetical protein